MKILFISSICDKGFFDQLIKNEKNFKPSIAGQRFEKMIAEGINKKEEIEVLSTIPVSSYPKYSKVFCRKKSNLVLDSIRTNYIFFVNLFLLKQISIFLYSLVFIFFWILKNKDDKLTILLNVAYIPTSLAAIINGKLFNVHISTLIPDVSDYRFNYSDNSNLRTKLLNIFAAFSKKIERKFDSYIFLTEEMNNLINVNKKPYLVMEGLWKDVFGDYKKTVKKDKGKKVVMYAGSIMKKYGIEKLVKAFLQINDKKTELWIFGKGDYENELKEINNEFDNIKYFGLVPHSEIIKYELESDLLVNPRPTNEEFTKYSFPSKTIEYMASGTPLLTTRLEGIPEEYFDYVFLFKDEDVIGIKEKICSIINKDCDYLNSFGKRARKFILTQKNYLNQTNEILDFLKEMND